MSLFLQGPLWKRGLLFLSSIPITVVMNSDPPAINSAYRGALGIEPLGLVCTISGGMISIFCAALMVGEALLNLLGRSRVRGATVCPALISFSRSRPAGAAFGSEPYPTACSARLWCSLDYPRRFFFSMRARRSDPTRSMFPPHCQSIGRTCNGHAPRPKSLLDELKLDDYLCLADYNQSRVR